jgi:cyclic pyranopterin monophosphate synthase
MNKLSHTNETGKARMVDVGDKDVVKRTARATGFIKISDEALALVKDNAMKKGDVLTVAEIAGVQAAKSASSLIPLSHNINLDQISVIASIQDGGIQIDSEVSCTGKTGVEMEALTAVSVALLTIYDMCKAADKKMEIVTVRLVEKKKSVIIA